jgi:hypothetical protein
VTDDRRGLRRSRVLLSGIVLYGPNAFTVDCAIRNLTEVGAHIRLPDPVALVVPLVLIDLVHAKASKAELIWARGSDCGLAFTGEIDFQSPTTDVGRLVRRLWLERRAR